MFVVFVLNILMVRDVVFLLMVMVWCVFVIDVDLCEFGVVVGVLMEYNGRYFWDVVFVVFGVFLLDVWCLYLVLFMELLYINDVVVFCF